ncbi:MAG: protein kinase domain-containing protein, partial [Gemmatimonadales bacterium]
IVPVYDSGSADGLLYYVMPFIEGESLRDRLQREGRCRIEEAVSLISEAGSALTYAHGQGVVHRDIKPENIMISGGHAVVADFGIARAIDAAAAGSTRMTGIGMAIGTPAYMSPEQATASDDVDARSDQYSLACVFYEMVTGEQPFAGSTIQAVITRSITGPRPHLRTVVREAPAAMDPVVVKALSQDPAERFETVEAFTTALRGSSRGGRGLRLDWRVGIGVAALMLLFLLAGWYFGRRPSGPVVAGAERIAVMPFRTTGQAVEYLGEGMVDLLSTNLNTVGGISAADPRTVLARWREAGAGVGAGLNDALAIGREVDAGAVIMGSIISTGPNVRMSADLYGADGERLAQAQVEGSSDSVLALVDNLSTALVREVWRSSEPVPTL